MLLAPTRCAAKQQANCKIGQNIQRPNGTTTLADRRVVSLNSVAAASEQIIYRDDPLLEGHRPHLDYRWLQYTAMKQAIVKAEGSLAEFARGYEKFGINRANGTTTYREWAPAAQEAWLIGEFNNWEGTPLEKDEFGVWATELRDNADGKPAIPHNSKVKIRLKHWDGWTIDLVPAWIKYAVMPEGMDSTFDGVHWDPPANERHQWKNRKPARPESLRIYEAHVGMSSEEPVMASYTHFKDSVLPRIKQQGYNCVQLMAVQEHPYYGSFGYHVTNPFAPASRSGDPEELKALIDEAHGMGILVLLDVVHSHICKNQLDGLAGFDFGQEEGNNYFCAGERGYHSVRSDFVETLVTSEPTCVQQWDSRLMVYRNWEVQRYLLSNVRWWLDEYQFDGFRFDGVTSMLYHHHGINHGFSGNYSDYFSEETNVDACVYLMLANELMHDLNPQTISIAEDVSGMPALGRPVREGGMGFDYRLGMAIPDLWIDLLKNYPDETWSMNQLVGTLCNRRYTEKTVAYAQSHDQSIVGDKTVAMWLMNAELYDGMSTFEEASPVIVRGMALHKMIHGLTMAIASKCVGGEAWLTFMGNEFGHPEWIDFPREGNEWSHKHCRRQWSLADTDHLRYHQLNNFDRDLNHLDEVYNFSSHPHQIVSEASDDRKLLVCERGALLFVFNFHTTEDYVDLKVGVGEGGKYKLILDSDALHLGGQGRVPWDPEMFSRPEGVPGQPDTNFNNRPHSIIVQSPSRTMVVYANMDQKELWDRATNGTSDSNGGGAGNGGSQNDDAYFFPRGEVKSFF